MDDLAGCLVSLIGLVMLIGVAVVGFMLATSQAVLISEKQSRFSSNSFACTYFTGLRVVESASHSHTGCPRFIKVGE